MNKSPKLLDQVRDKLRVKHYAIRTEQSYVDWIKRYIYFHGKTHPKDLAAQDVEAFLTHLAVAGKVSASTQNQAKSALLFLYREVLEIKLPWLDNITQAKAPKKLPVVLTVSRQRLSGSHLLIASLLGGGMRLMEAMRLRVRASAAILRVPFALDKTARVRCISEVLINETGKRK